MTTLISPADAGSSAARAAAELARAGYHGYSAPPGAGFGHDPAWQALVAAGTRLWLDTGDLQAARELWTADFASLTTNNTLVNQEVQKGGFDGTIREAGRVLRDVDAALGEEALVLEVGFVVNCRVALRLVAAFDAFVSVELHPGIAEDAAASVAYGRRYHQVCPERFIIKVPLTPAGYVAARVLAAEGIPVNYTLGFSARQNVVAAEFSRPAYVNIFMGRLGSFLADNGLGDGANAGERATLASQNALLAGRRQRGWTTLQIGASMRSASQLYTLAGLDVFTMPVAAAREFHRRYHAGETRVVAALDQDLPVVSTIPEALRCLWEVPDDVLAAGEALRRALPDPAVCVDGAEVAGIVREHVPDLFREWSPAELHEIAEGGKIPSWARWREEVVAGRAALDDLMRVAALQSFVRDQAQLDERIRRVLREAGVVG